MLLWAVEMFATSWEIQEDGSPAYHNRKAKEWFAENSVLDMEWQPRSFDHNLTQNFCFVLGQEVYGNNRQLTTTVERISSPWDFIVNSFISSFVKSIGNSLLHVVLKNRWVTGYRVTITIPPIGSERQSPTTTGTVNKLIPPGRSLKETNIVEIRIFGC